LAKERLRVVVNHGQIRATSSGPSIHVNNSNIQATLNRFKSEILDQSGEEYHVFVLHAYPWTGNIPGYIRDRKRAYNQLRRRVLILNKNHLSVANPVRIVLDYAMKLDIHIVFGPLYEIAGPKMYKTTIMATPDGDIVKYRAMCLSKVERELRINPGKEPAVFEITRNGRVVGRLGIFIDEDLTCPEPFRYYRLAQVDAVVGQLLPYPSEYLKIVEQGDVVTVQPCLLDKLLTTRAIDAGAPIILVGGVLTLHTGGRKVRKKYWGPTTIMDPDGPDIEVCPDLNGFGPMSGRPFLTLDDVDRMKKIIIERSQSVEEKSVEAPICRRQVQKRFREACQKQGG